jgi:hypothetical protein
VTRGLAVTVHASLACWPGAKHEEAALLASGDLREPLFGPIGTEHVQLVPQNFGVLTVERAANLAAAWPASQFRLHANVRVLAQHRFADLSTFDEEGEWFAQAAVVSKQLGAPAYSLHSGSRARVTVAQMLVNARRCEDLFDCPVAVEGQYPTKGDTLLVSSWAEYRQVFESGRPYALDLSHLNILVKATGCCEAGLVREMLDCERCIEVHVSDNDGRGDSHQVCEREPWWFGLLDYINERAVVFTEGNHRRKRRA